MLRLSPLLSLRLRAPFAALLLCGLVLQALGLPALASVDGAMATSARCADPNSPGSPLPDSPAPVHGAGDHCMLCAAQEAVFTVVALLGLSVATDAAPASQPPDAPQPPGGLARDGWGSSWSSQAPPAA